MIIDCHAHLSTYDDDALIPYARSNSLSYSLDELLENMRRFEVTDALLLSPPRVDGSIVPNEHTIRLCELSNWRLKPVLTVEPSKEHVESCIKLAKSKKQVRAFKIRLGYVKVSPIDPVFLPLYEYALSSGLPVLFHTGDTATKRASLKHAHPLNLDELASSFDKLKIVVCHFGNPWIVDAAELVYKHNNVYADLSGLFSGYTRFSKKYIETLVSQLNRAIYYIGSVDRILFGTDYPVEDHERAIQLVKSLDLDENELKLVFYENAKGLFAL